MKNILYIFFFCSLGLIAQTTPSQNQNYLHTTVFQNPYTETEVNSGGIPDIDKIESITYYDGLGRPSQSNAVRGGGNGSDIITPMVYDPLGRQAKQYLPFPANSGNNGSFETGPISLQENYYANAYPDDIYGTSPLNTFSEQRFEASPLGRVLEQGAPGNAWKVNPTSDTDHTIKYDYTTNGGNSVFHFKVGFNSGNTDAPYLILNSNTYWPATTLYTTHTRDENWDSGDGIFGRSFEYKNTRGQVLLKRINVFDPAKGPSSDNFHDTYYIYDDFGNLTFVLSPEASEQIVDINGNLVSNSQEILDDYGYQYKYDHRNRLIEKKIPGKDWEYIVYDVLDRPVLTQDINLRNDNNKWLFTKYDALGRVVYTGIYTPPAGQTRTSIQNDPLLLIPPQVSESRTTTPTTIGDTQVYYTNAAYPGANKILKVLTVNYYDSYVDDDGMGQPNTVFGATTLTTPKGLPTVSRVRVLDDTAVSWIWSQTVYDGKGRAVFGMSQNDYLGTTDLTFTQLDFTRKVLQTNTEHSRTGFDNISYSDYFTYDHVGRLKTHKQKIGQEEVQTIASNSYDVLGQLGIKKVGGVTYVDGYTDLVDVSVDSYGKITKASNGPGWTARAKTRGVIPSLYEGGIDVFVSQQDKMVRLGLVFGDAGNQPNNFYSYGFQLDQNRNVFTIENGTTAIQVPNRQYATGDLFRIERVLVTSNPEVYNVLFYHNNDVVKTITNIQLDAEKILTGKVSFSGSAGSVDSAELFGPNLNKRLQAVNYKYNVRGWLTDINDIGTANTKTLDTDQSDDLFHFRISYNRVHPVTGVEPLYNGNISQTFWRTENTDTSVRGYTYGYDQLNRIKQALSIQGSDMTNLAIGNTYDLFGVDYDKNGNVSFLSRNGKETPTGPITIWDDLAYEYQGNQLINVSDINSANLGFYDGNAGTTQNPDYVYDSNGNMTVDKNKGITAITYNHLNLPETLAITSTNGNGNGTISYIYDATGVKLKKVFNNGSGDKTTEYAGNFIYNDGSGGMLLEFFNHPEGYVIPLPEENPPGGGGPVLGFDDDTGQTTISRYAYVFQYKDHLGNVRLSYSDSDGNGSIDPATEIIEESNYYPFGLKQKGYNYNIQGGNSLAQQWKFGGKELSQELGLNTYDFGARNYMPDLGRWSNIDNLADHPNQIDKSPYAYGWNNPVFFTDPDGNCPICLVVLFGAMLLSPETGMAPTGNASDGPAYQSAKNTQAGFLLVALTAGTSSSTLGLSTELALDATGVPNPKDLSDLTKSISKNGDDLLSISNIAENKKVGELGEKLTTGKIEAEFPDKDVLNQVTGNFDDGTRVRFDDIVADPKTTKVELVNETKVSKNGDGKLSSGQKKFFIDGKPVTLTGKNAEYLKGKSISKENTQTRITNIRTDLLKKKE